MIYKQNHSSIWVYRLLGYCLFGCSATLLAPIVINVFSAIQKNIAWDEAAALSSLAAIFMIGLLFISFYYLWMYPDISISSNGLRITSIFLTWQFPWADIEFIERISNKQLIIAIDKKGLFYQRLYGLLRAGKFDKAVILFRSDPATISRLENDLNAFITTYKKI